MKPKKLPGDKTELLLHHLRSGAKIIEYRDHFASLYLRLADGTKRGVSTVTFEKLKPRLSAKKTLGLTVYSFQENESPVAKALRG